MTHDLCYKSNITAFKEQFQNEFANVSMSCDFLFCSRNRCIVQRFKSAHSCGKSISALELAGCFKALLQTGKRSSRYL